VTARYPRRIDNLNVTFLPIGDLREELGKLPA
jgi:hypothetical protein